MTLEFKKLTKSYEVVKKVVLTPKLEGAQPEYEYSSERSYSYDGFHDDIENNRVSFNPYEWDIQVEYGKTEKYLKVAAVVGDAKAHEVMEALGL